MVGYLDAENQDLILSFLSGFCLALILSSALVINNSGLDFGSGNKELSAQEVGNRTVEMVNRRILHNTPNNVTGSLVDVREADPSLNDFYVVSVDVQNPTSSEITQVYAKKDGSLVFLNSPRYYDPDKYDSQNYE